jgi:hypothetical protein
MLKFNLSYSFIIGQEALKSFRPILSRASTTSSLLKGWVDVFHKVGLVFTSRSLLLAGSMFCHQSLKEVVMACWAALGRSLYVCLWELRMALLVATSARSFPTMPVWPGHQARTTLLLREVWIYWICKRTLRMMGWLAHGFWRAFRHLRESEAMRMMGGGSGCEEQCSLQSRCLGCEDGGETRSKD